MDIVFFILCMAIIIGMGVISITSGDNISGVAYILVALFFILLLLSTL